MELRSRNSHFTSSETRSRLPFFRGRLCKTFRGIPRFRAGSTNYRHAIFLKLLIGRDHRQVVQSGGGDDEAVARVVVDRWKLGGSDADVQFERENRQPMV